MLDFQVIPQQLIPYHWSGVLVQNDLELLGLGAAKLSELLEHWLRQKQIMVERMRILQNEIDALRDNAALVRDLKADQVETTEYLAQIEKYIDYLSAAVKKARDFSWMD